ncbi:hypothetical protein TNCV_854281 [Trichonephila clavipes]|nr:hypothetical protein TNCV_854281 [Trichonephila clavipes]
MYKIVQFPTEILGRVYADCNEPFRICPIDTKMIEYHLVFMKEMRDFCSFSYTNCILTLLPGEKLMPRVKSINTYQHSKEFDKDRIISYQYCGLSYCSVAARVCQDPMTVIRVWNLWFQDDNMEYRAVSQQPPISSNREDRHAIRISLILSLCSDTSKCTLPVEIAICAARGCIDHAAQSRAQGQELGLFSRQQMSARTV